MPAPSGDGLTVRRTHHAGGASDGPPNLFLKRAVIGPARGCATLSAAYAAGDGPDHVHRDLADGDEAGEAERDPEHRRALL